VFVACACRVAGRVVSCGHGVWGVCVSCRVTDLSGVAASGGECDDETETESDFDNSFTPSPVASPRLAPPHRLLSSVHLP
jgi:hypothetical protein